MKILIASTPATGHLNPMLAITQILRGDGHEIAFLTGTAFRARVEASGVKFFPLVFTIFMFTVVARVLAARLSRTT